MLGNLLGNSKQGQKNAILQDTGGPKKVKVTWSLEKESQKVLLEEGKYFIGTSSFCQIPLAKQGKDIYATLIVKGDKVILEIKDPKVPIYFDGTLARKGDRFEVFDVANFAFGRTPVSFDRLSSSLLEDSPATKEDPQDSRWDRENTINLRKQISDKLIDELNLHGIEITSIDSGETKALAHSKLRKFSPKSTKISREPRRLKSMYTMK